MSDDIWRLGVTELRDAYARGDLAPTEAVRALAERIEQVDPLIGAFTTLTLDRAMTDAVSRSDELARGEARGPLHGIPVAIKELFDVAGAVTTYGSVIFAGRLAAADAEAVRNLREAGAIVMGLTRSHEIGWGITTQSPVMGSTLNPWNLSRVPGGSSGGSAAALASGMVPLALGTDTGGSIRIPGCYCGVAGLKPTHGAVAVAGALPLAPSLDHAGPMARRVADLALGLSALTGGATWLSPDQRGDAPLPGDATRQLVVGVVPDLHLRALTSDHQRVFDHAVAALDSRGAAISQFSFPDAQRIRPAFATIQMAEAYHVHSAVLGVFPQRAAEYSPDVRGRLEQGAAVTIGEYLTARDTQRQVTRRFAELLARADVLLTPVTSAGPSLAASPDYCVVGGRQVAFRDLVMDYTVPQNLTGLPACVVPAGFDDQGIPVGVQVTSGRGREDLALRAAAVLEEALAGEAGGIAPATGRS